MSISSKSRGRTKHTAGCFFVVCDACIKRVYSSSVIPSASWCVLDASLHQKFPTGLLFVAPDPVLLFWQSMVGCCRHYRRRKQITTKKQNESSQIVLPEPKGTPVYDARCIEILFKVAEYCLDVRNKALVNDAVPSFSPFCVRYRWGSFPRLHHSVSL